MRGLHVSGKEQYSKAFDTECLTQQPGCAEHCWYRCTTVVFIGLAQTESFAVDSAKRCTFGKSTIPHKHMGVARGQWQFS
ncbi:hypothetical protein AUEXF2481DRAFT_41062, partial [Aureobasidium subglaciale EXF-2481]